MYASIIERIQVVIIIILGLGIFMLGILFSLAYFAYDSASEIKDYNSFVIKILFLLCIIGIGVYSTERGIMLLYFLRRRKGSIMLIYNF